jgi:PHD/YefM family antitoxin component YafN of YafNO toxin-antitoxin module
MRSIEISTASKTLAEYASDLDDDFVVLTSNSKPVAAIVSLKNIDPESLALSTNAEFLEIIDQARREVAAGKTISMEGMKEQFGL